MGFSDIFQTIWVSLLSLSVLLVLTKLMGNRQMSQLTLFDYIAGISIGSIAAELSAHPDEDILLGLVSMVVYATFTLLLNDVNTKSLRLRRILLGKPLVLYDNGILYYNNLKKAKLDLTEFMTECRTQGYFDLSKLQLILFEVNGRLSFLPMEGERPMTPMDMQLDVKQERPAMMVVMDGEVQPGTLKETGNDENWLHKQMALQGFTSVEDIFLATVDNDNNLAIYEKNEDKQSKRYYD